MGLGKKLDVEKTKAMFSGIDGYPDSLVPRLTGDAGGDGPDFVENLTDTARVYLPAVLSEMEMGGEGADARKRGLKGSCGSPFVPDDV